MINEGSPTHNLSTLRNTLANLYPDRADARRIVADAGMNPLHIEFRDKAITNWHNILDETKKHGYIDQLIKVVFDEYPTNADLISAVKEYRLTDTSDIENYTITLILQKLQHVEKYLLSPYSEWPERPKNSKRNATWDIIEKFRQVVRYGWHYNQCKDEQRRLAMISAASFQLDEIARDIDKVSLDEHRIIFFSCQNLA